MRASLVEIAPGIRGMDCGGVNVYFIEDGSGGTALLDAGLPGSAARILGGLEAAGEAATDIKLILLSHADVDHVGGLSRLASLSGARVLAGRRTIAFIRRGRVPPHIGLPHILPVLALNRFRGAPPAAMEAVEDGELLPLRGGLRALAAPGHTEDHFAYFLEKEGILFCGDLYRASTGFAPFGRYAQDASANAASHSRLSSLGARLVCPGHGPCFRL